jgi:hypothetical protein
MTYTLCFDGQPVHHSTNWLEIHDLALELGFATLAWGCLFVKAPGVTIRRT